MTIAAAKRVPAGKKVFFVGHSFHMFVVRPLITLAKEAGIAGHWAEGWDMIAGRRRCSTGSAAATTTR